MNLNMARTMYMQETTFEQKETIEDLLKQILINQKMMIVVLTEIKELLIVKKSRILKD
jgi:hypothetical protein